MNPLIDETLPPGEAAADRAKAGDGHDAAAAAAQVAAGDAGSVTAAAGPATVRAMLEARTVALVGASPRPGSFGSRMLAEVAKSPARPAIYPVNPRYPAIGDRACYPSLAELPGPPDLTLLAVPDTALERELRAAAQAGSRGAVIFGNAHSAAAASPGGAAAAGSPAAPALRDRLAAIAREAGMALCGAGCMGFVNVSYGLRAIGYVEPDPLPAGPVALVTHSGSVFSALLRTRRSFGFTLAVSSGQELVTAAPAYLDYALGLPGTRVLALVLEAIRDGAELRQVLAAATARDVPVVLLAAGRSARGRAMVAAHSGALAGSDGGWEALARAHGVHRVSDLAELADTLELFVIGRKARAAVPGLASGIATVHDSGLERAHVADVAESEGIPFAEIGTPTTARLTDLLDPGLVPANPLDVWGTGASTRELFAGSLLALAADPAVQAVALAVDLVHELDGDDAYLRAVLDANEQADTPLAVLANLPSAIDQAWAGRLRAGGVPVLEGTRSGLRALAHLLDQARLGCTELVSPERHQLRTPGPLASLDLARQARGRALLEAAGTSGARLLDLLAEYGIPVARTLAADDLAGTLAAADEAGYPVVLKTGQPGIAHKSDVGGVVLGIRDAASLARAYAELSARLGPRVLVSHAEPAGVELAVGIVTDPALGPLVVVGAGGVLVELLADRAVALPPVPGELAAELLAGLRVGKLLAGVRGAPPVSIDAVVKAIRGVSALALELGDQIEALDINPLICGPEGAVAVDVLAIGKRDSAGS